MRSGTSFDLFANFVLLPLAALVILFFSVRTQEKPPMPARRTVIHVLLALLGLSLFCGVLRTL